MIRSLLRLCLFCAVASTFVFAQGDGSTVNLPSSKKLTIPSPGRIGATNSFPGTVVISPDRRYAALLNYGHGTQETLGRQSISVLDLGTNQIADYPDARFP